TRLRLSPGSPSRAKPGALRFVEARAALPSPPRPPAAAVNSVPSSTRSAMMSPSVLLTTVPSGTAMTRFLPSAPERRRRRERPRGSARPHVRADGGGVARGEVRDGADGKALAHRTRGHGDDAVLPVRAVAQIALADPAAVGAQVRTMVQRQQCGGLSVDAEDDVAAVASVGTVGAAERFELLAPDRGAPVPTVAGGEVNGDTIYELGGHNVLISDEG